MTLTPGVIVQVERKFGTIPPVESTLYGAWLKLGRPDTFDRWLETIDSMDETATEERPTQPEASDGS